MQLLNQENIFNNTYNNSENEVLNSTLDEDNSKIENSLKGEKLINKKLEETGKKSNLLKISNEKKNKIESIIDQIFEEEYDKLRKQYEDNIEDLIKEQEKIFNKNEILKAKYSALEKYLRYFCRKSNIDYENLILSNE